MKARDLPAQLPIASELSDSLISYFLEEAARSIGPDGRYIVEPLFE